MAGSGRAEEVAELIIGSGPSAYGYLVGKKCARRRCRSLLITTTSTDARVPGLHPKLTVRGQLIVEPGPVSLHDGAQPVLITSAFGGLSNAWGGVLASLDRKELEEMYGPEGGRIEQFYDPVIAELSIDHVLGEYTFPSEPKVHVIRGRDPSAWETGGLSVGPGVERLCRELDTELWIPAKLLSLSAQGDGWMAQVEKDGDQVSIAAQRVVLAAGSPGNQRIFGGAAALSDHVPYQILQFAPFARKSDQLVGEISRQRGAIDVDYWVRHLSGDFLRKMAGAPAPLLAWMAKRLPLVLTQSWTGRTKARRTGVQWKSGSALTSIADLMRTVVRLTARGRMPLACKKTPAGAGFHYGDPVASRAPPVPGLVVLGGSRVRNLPVAHPSLSFMAHAALEAANEL
ncbi:hypothetical protein [Pseudomarimonas salicorniae]|uniref:Uncharacterized protein n=1 Tax=Pseudomarimonas salicorniae TaxID=2933270 RepID=A0ABT0GKC4_9GAMM|nr:hypothetical protein [Lysobacter sp. CAU 1642]MCK7594465.1 hypothetical protein [Lysobacter sp. CAU 1642]